MGLAETQRVYAQLYTNPVFRKRFFADPQGMGEALGLTAEELLPLTHVSDREVEFFARTLYRKRLSEVSKLLPLTRLARGKDFAAVFERYAETSVPKGIKKHCEDALAFVAFIEQSTGVEGSEPPWIRDLTRYEAAGLKAAGMTCGLTLRWFRYPVWKIAHSTAHGGGTWLCQPTIAIWFRFSQRGRLRRLVLSLPRLGMKL